MCGNVTVGWVRLGGGGVGRRHRHSAHSGLCGCGCALLLYGSGKPRHCHTVGQCMAAGETALSLLRHACMPPGFLTLLASGRRQHQHQQQQHQHQQHASNWGSIVEVGPLTFRCMLLAGGSSRQANIRKHACMQPQAAPLRPAHLPLYAAGRRQRGRRRVLWAGHVHRRGQPPGRLLGQQPAGAACCCCCRC